jgi:hypothetical protein
MVSVCAIDPDAVTLMSGPDTFAMMIYPLLACTSMLKHVVDAVMCVFGADECFLSA